MDLNERILQLERLVEQLKTEAAKDETPFDRLSREVNELIRTIKETQTHYDALQEAFREWFEEMAERTERIEWIVFLLLGKAGNGGKLQNEFIQLRAESAKRQINTYRKDLLRLQEKRAKYGLNPPTSLEVEIDEAEQAIKKLEEQLKNGPDNSH